MVEVSDGRKKTLKLISKSKMPKCQFCGSEFKKETTLQVHLCEKKRRHDQKDHYGVRLGFNAWIRFFEINVPSKKDLSYVTFTASPYYTAFVKFGNFLESVNCFDPKHAIEWYLKSNIKIDDWTKDKNYDKWIKDFVINESVDSGLERTIKFTEKWAEVNSSVFNHYFMYENKNKVCYAINAGKISPWVVFNCKSGVEFLDSLDDENIMMIIDLITPDHWNARFARYKDDVVFIKEILDGAGF
jgi:hypothetical protein